MKILWMLSKDARIPLLELAVKTGTSAATVSKHIRQLQSLV
ncbi:MAG: winged helix-turn-helix transcriptional regulator [Candidatus Thermoplasmatota archaeon]|nr:winged helix-turn-helix transcriptional regulator [Candidatus Thermoplasmatota archaeon]MBU1940553.1 winged helix-turn-helix transcriptional regulator [Candidatus Thermoplasmatota archaeon]